MTGLAFEKPGKPKRSKKIMNRCIRLHDVTRLNIPCVRCDKYTGTERHSHYEGMMKAKLGKGIGVKVPDEYTAWLCQDCTNNMDQKPPKDDYLARLEHDNEWAHLIIKTLIFVQKAS